MSTTTPACAVVAGINWCLLAPPYLRAFLRLSVLMLTASCVLLVIRPQPDFAPGFLVGDLENLVQCRSTICTAPKIRHKMCNPHPTPHRPFPPRSRCAEIVQGCGILGGLHCGGFEPSCAWIPCLVGEMWSTHSLLSTICTVPKSGTKCASTNTNSRARTILFCVLSMCVFVLLRGGNGRCGVG